MSYKLGLWLRQLKASVPSLMLCVKFDKAVFHEGTWSNRCRQLPRAELPAVIQFQGRLEMERLSSRKPDKSYLRRLANVVPGSACRMPLLCLRRHWSNFYPARNAYTDAPSVSH
jgi:hypothetical protein